MMIWFPFSATIQKEENSYVSICPEADVICKGKTVEGAIENLKKEVKEFWEKNCPVDFRKLFITNFFVTNFCKRTK